MREGPEGTPKPGKFLAPGILEPEPEFREGNDQGDDEDPLPKLQCLESEPASRPASALAVAAALPGGDPLAAALTAGETPSPEIVAAAGQGSEMSRRMALTLFAVIVTGLLAGLLIPGQEPLIPLPENPPEVMVADMRELLEQIGHTERVRDVAYGFRIDSEQLDEIEEGLTRKELRERTGSMRPAPISLWYRTSPAMLRSSPVFPFLTPFGISGGFFRSALSKSPPTTSWRLA